MPLRPAQDLREMMAEILTAVGTKPEAASFIGDSLVAANLAGHDSHGVIRLLHYVEMVRSGKVHPEVEPVELGRTGATARIDGGWGWGQPAMWLATETAIELASQFGLGAVTVIHSYHIGRVAPYVEAIAQAGMVGMAFANAGPAVAPYGGKDRVMGTNPIAWAAPRADGLAPVCLDVATASVAEGKLRVARARGVPVPPGQIVNAEGQPSIDPNDFYDGGALLTFGAHKGSGFSLLSQILGVGLAGASAAALGERRGGNGPFVLAINVSAFTPLDQFIDAVETTAANVHASAPMEGFNEVLLPGEPEVAIRIQRERDGIPVPDRTWDDLRALAADLGIGVTAGA